MKKLIVIIVIAVVIVVVAITATFYLREPAEISAPVEKEAELAGEFVGPSPELVEELSFDANDNLDQALEDLRVLEEARF